MRTMMRLVLVGLVLGMLQVGAAAETKELRVAKQYGLGYLQMMVMEEKKLVEKHTKAAGLGDVKVNWSTFRSSDVMNDALLSGNLDFASLGTNGLAIIWAKTKGTPVEVKGAAGFNFLPLALVTREANVKTVADYTEKHKIAVPAVRVSNQAILLQMAAAKQFGQANYTKLDSLTVSMTHPDAMAALLSGAGEVGSHFASSPFLQKELEKPGIRQIVSLHRDPGRPSQLQHPCHHDQVPRRQPQGLCRLPVRHAGGDGDHQPGQTCGSGAVHPDDQGQELHGRNPENHERLGRVQLQPAARGGHADDPVHAQHRLDQVEARVLERSAIPYTREVSGA